MDSLEPVLQGALKASLEMDAKIVCEVSVMDSFEFGTRLKFTLEVFLESIRSKEVLEDRRGTCEPCLEML